LLRILRIDDGVTLPLPGRGAERLHGGLTVKVHYKVQTIGAVKPKNGTPVKQICREVKKNFITTTSAVSTW